MADLVKKQLVAVIDHRTTTICLHAAGQIKPVDEPFDTLLGPLDEPPFHAHCRSMVVPHMTGFYRQTRKDANAELRRRPPSAKKHLPPPPKKIVRVKGRQRSEVQKELDALKPDTSLALVPPQIRKAFVEAHPERFELTSNGGGISESYWVKDLHTGDRYVLKAGKYHNESVNEVIGTRLGAEMGLPGEALVASNMGTGNGWVLLRHAEDLDDLKAQGYKVIGTGGGHKQIAQLASRLEDQGEAVKKLLVDFVTDEADAKGGNLLLMSKDGGKTVRLVPIDRSLSQMGWRGATEPGAAQMVKGDWTLKARMDVADLRTYMKTRGSPKGVLDMLDDIVAQPGGSKIVIDAYDEVVAGLKTLDMDRLTVGLSEELVKENRRLIQSRIDTVIEQRDKMLRQMGVKDVTGFVDEAVPLISKADPDLLRGMEILKVKGTHPFVDRGVSMDEFLDQVPQYREVYEKTARQLAVIERKFPRLMDELEEIRFDREFDPGTAWYEGVNRRITVNLTHMGEPDYARRYQMSAEKGWYATSPDVDGIAATITHEVGHHMDTMLDSLREGRRGDAWDVMWRDIGKEMRKTDDTIRSGTAARSKLALDKHGARMVSEYGATDPEEFIAEAFAEYMHSPNPRPVARIVGSAFEDAFGAMDEAGAL